MSSSDTSRNHIGTQGVQLRVLSYNIRYASAEDEVPWSTRSYHLVALLRFHEPDIIGIQEALPRQTDDIHAALPDYEWIGVSRDGGTEGELTPLFFRKSRLKLEWHLTRWLSETPHTPGSRGWDADNPRTVVAALLNDRRTGRRFRVYNTHFDNDGKEAVKQSVTLLEQWTREDSGDEPSPCVILGDLNMVENSEVYRRLAGTFSDALRVSKEPVYGPEYTYIGPGFRVADTVGTRYDYILTGSGVQVLRTATLTDSLHGRYPSDHLPVISDIVIE